MRSIAELWGSFEAIVVPVDAGREQRSAMRDAFYAGAHGIFSLLVAQISPGTGEPTDADLELMDELNRELKAYVLEARERAARNRRRP